MLHRCFGYATSHFAKSIFPEKNSQDNWTTIQNLEGIGNGAECPKSAESTVVTTTRFLSVCKYPSVAGSLILYVKILVVWKPLYDISQWGSLHLLKSNLFRHPNQPAEVFESTRLTACGLTFSLAFLYTSLRGVCGLSTSVTASCLSACSWAC